MRRPSLPSLALCAVLLTACSGSDDGAAGSDPTAAPSGTSSDPSSPAPDELAELEPEQVLERAKAAFLEAGSVRVVGGLTEQDEQFSLDVAVQGGQGGRGSVSTSGVTFQIVTVGTDVYFAAPDAFWEQTAGPEAAAELRGKFVRSTTENADFADLASFTDLQALADDLFAPEGELEALGESELDGQQVVGLRDADGGVLYVAAEGEPLPVRLVQSEGAAEGDGRVDFRDYGSPVDLTPPAEVVDAAELGQP